MGPHKKFHDPAHLAACAASARVYAIKGPEKNRKAREKRASDKAALLACRAGRAAVAPQAAAAAVVVQPRQPVVAAVVVQPAAAAAQPRPQPAAARPIVAIVQQRASQRQATAARAALAVVVQPQPQPQPQPRAKRARAPSSASSSAPSSTGAINLAEVEKAIDTIKGILPKDGSKTKCKLDMKVVFRLTGCTDLRECLKNTKKIDHDIQTGKQTMNPNKTYAINSIRDMYMSIVRLIDHLPSLKGKFSKEVMDHYHNKMEEFKLKSYSQQADRIVDLARSVQPYNDFLIPAVERVFDKESKENLVVGLLFPEVPMRDNYKALRVVNDEQEAEQTPDNCIIIPPQGHATIFIKDYKTVEKYGKVKGELSLPLSDALRKYRSKNSRSEYLFGKSPLTAFIGKTLDAVIGKENNRFGAFNYLRQSWISTQGEMTDEDKVILARQMGHSPAAQIKYFRLLVRSDKDI